MARVGSRAAGRRSRRNQNMGKQRAATPHRLHDRWRRFAGFHGRPVAAAFHFAGGHEGHQKFGVQFEIGKGPLGFRTGEEHLVPADLHIHQLIGLFSIE